MAGFRTGTIVWTRGRERSSVGTILSRYGDEEPVLNFLPSFFSAGQDGTIDGNGFSSLRKIFTLLYRCIGFVRKNSVVQSDRLYRVGTSITKPLLDCFTKKGVFGNSKGTRV